MIVGILLCLAALGLGIACGFTPFAILVIVAHFAALLVYGIVLRVRDESQKTYFMLLFWSVKALQLFFLSALITLGTLFLLDLDHYPRLYLSRAVRSARLVAAYAGSPVQNLRASIIIDDYIREMVDELRDGEVLYSDGLLSEAVTASAAKGGKSVTVLNVSDRAALEGMRSVLVGEVEGSNSVFNLESAFRIVKGRTLSIRGLVATLRPGARSNDDAVLALVHRVLDFYDRDGDPNNLDQYKRSDLVRIQWRLARMVGLRAKELDGAGKTEPARAMEALSDELDRRNPAAPSLHDTFDRLLSRAIATMTPEEGLRFSMSRADFSLGRFFARQILEKNPESVPANFSEAMEYIREHQYARAEYHLQIALKAKPDEPAILNNLAYVQLRLGRLDAAERNALAARRLLPGNREIESTLREITARKCR